MKCYRYMLVSIPYSLMRSRTMSAGVGAYTHLPRATSHTMTLDHTRLENPFCHLTVAV